jgi:mannosyltransferase
MGNHEGSGEGFQRRLFVPSLCTVLIVAGVLRAYQIGDESYWMDEVTSLHVAVGAPMASLVPGAFDRPPVYFIPLHFWVHVFGTAEASARSLSAVIGVASVALIYVVGRGLFGEETGLVAAFVMGISAFQIYYSQEVRYYSLFVFMTLLSFLFFIRAMERSTLTDYGLYAGATILLVYTHAFGVFVLAAQDLYFLLRRNGRRRGVGVWVICQALIILSLVPLFGPSILGGMPIAGMSAPGGRAWISDPALVDTIRSIYRFVFPMRGDRTWGSVLAGYGLGVVAFAAGMSVFIIRRGKREWWVSAKGLFGSRLNANSRKDSLLLVGCWLLLPVALPFVLSKLLGPMYLDRYAISAAPALYLLLAFGLVGMRRVVPLLFSLGTLVILVAPGLRYYYATYVNEEWREVARYVEANASAGDVVVVAPDEDGSQQRSFEWYYKGNLTACGLASDLAGDVTIGESLVHCTSGHGRFWLIMRGTAETVGRFKEFFLERRPQYVHLDRHLEFTGISVFLFELSG